IKVNARLLFGLIAFAVAFGVGIHLLHGYQVRRTAGDLLVDATKEQDAGNPGKAADFLSLYLSYVPEDVDAKARLWLLRADVPSSGKGRLRAFLALEGVLRQEPARDDIRLRLAELAMKMGRERLNDARQHLTKLLEATPNNADLELRLGKCQEAD